MESLRKSVVQIAGSISKDTDINLVRFSHTVVKHLTYSLLENGYVVMTTVGREDTIISSQPNPPSQVFYWDILETTYNYANSFQNVPKNLAIVVSSEKLESEIPVNRKLMWKELLDKHIIRVIRIKPGWNAGAYKRQTQERYSDGLITLGGGEGTEHLISIYSSNGKMVLSLDIPLGSSFNDGIGASPLISRFEVSNPSDFIPVITDETTDDLINLSYSRWLDEPVSYGKKICSFVSKFLKLKVFYVRLMDEKAAESQSVERFFGEVVEVVVKHLGLTSIEIDKKMLLEPFLNMEIFKEIRHSSFLIVDLTGLRPNCFMELGFSLGLGKTVFLTAMSGTHLPFDTNQIPCFFWSPDKLTSDTQASFVSFLKRNVNRRPI